MRDGRYGLTAFFARDLFWHFAVAMILGALARGIVAYFVYAPMAVDDFTHALRPAWALAHGEEATLPPYRSWLLVWVLTAILRSAELLGIRDGLTLARLVGATLGVCSLGTVWAAYRYASRFALTWADRRGGAILIYLCALQCLMPFVGTRAFGEMVATPFLFLGFVLAERALAAGSGRALAGALGLVGIAVLFRFQVGVFYATYLALLAAERRGRAVGIAIAVGLGIVVAESLIDLLSGRAPFATLFAYLLETVGQARTRAMPSRWMFVGLLLALTLFPFSWPLARSLPKVGREHRRAVVALIAFTAVHSWPAYKEERFILPIVPFLWIVLAYAWSDALARGSRWVAWVYSPLFFAVNAALLPLVALNNTQAGTLEPVAELARAGEGGVVLEPRGDIAGDERARIFFGRAGIRFAGLAAEEIAPPALEAAWIAARAAAPDWRSVVFYAGQDPVAIEKLAALSGRASASVACDRTRLVSPPLDRLIYALNPARNRGRRPAYYLFCRRTVR